MSGCDASEVLKAAEYALDGVSVPIGIGQGAVPPGPVRLGQMLGIMPLASTERRMLLLS